MDSSPRFRRWFTKGLIFQKHAKGLMKMVECMEDEAFAHRKGEIKNKVIQKNQADPSGASKGHNKRKWGQGKLGLKMNKINQ